MLRAFFKGSVFKNSSKRQNLSNDLDQTWTKFQLHFPWDRQKANKDTFLWRREECEFVSNPMPGKNTSQGYSHEIFNGQEPMGDLLCPTWLIHAKEKGFQSHVAGIMWPQRQVAETILVSVFVIFFPLEIACCWKENVNFGTRGPGRPEILGFGWWMYIPHSGASSLNTRWFRLQKLGQTRQIPSFLSRECLFTAILFVLNSLGKWIGVHTAWTKRQLHVVLWLPLHILKYCWGPQQLRSLVSQNTISSWGKENDM